MFGLSKNVLSLVIISLIICEQAFAQTKAKTATKKVAPQKAIVKNITA